MILSGVFVNGLGVVAGGLAGLLLKQGISEKVKTLLMQGLALVNVGGLTASTILTLLLLPTFYRLVYKMGRKKIGGEGDLVIAD